MQKNKPGTELLSDLADRVSTVISNHLPPSVASSIAEEIACDMARHWGGQLIYFPKGRYVFLSKRDREIYSKFTGNNHAELAREYDLGIQQIYEIIKSMHRQELNDRHGDLFGPDPSL